MYLYIFQRLQNQYQSSTSTKYQTSTSINTRTSASTESCITFSSSINKPARISQRNDCPSPALNSKISPKPPQLSFNSQMSSQSSPQPSSQPCLQSSSSRQPMIFFCRNFLDIFLFRFLSFV